MINTKFPRISLVSNAPKVLLQTPFVVYRRYPFEMHLDGEQMTDMGFDGAAAMKSLARIVR